ncbi:MAG: DNA repair protein RecN [Pseudomonadota bacterium]
MLQSLQIENFAIINKLNVNFDSGLNIITGETGAGKTILVQAINLILGDRASNDLIRTGETKASVSAVFTVPVADKALKEYLEDFGLNLEDEDLIIHRQLSADGKSRATVNGLPVTQQVLRQIAERLVDISSQHEHQTLLNPEAHLIILDEFGGLQSLLKDYQQAHEEYLVVYNDLERLQKADADKNERLDFMKYQLQELKAAGLVPEEDQDLEVEKSRLKHAVQLETKMREVESALYDSQGSAVELVGQADQQLSRCAEIDQSIKPWLEALGRAAAELDEVSREVKKYINGLQADPARLEEIDDRLHLLKNLKKKHGNSLEACLEKQAQLESEILEIENWDEKIKEKEILLEQVSQERAKLAASLSAKRQQVAKNLAVDIEKETASLGFKKLKFVINFEALAEEKWDKTGAERIEFLIAPNVGEAAKPLAKIASGGELSRLMLAIKRCLAAKTQGCLASIFDEVDSGIGGATAEIVGQKLMEVAAKRQVICITHLPQIASFGQAHFRVEKTVKDGRTETLIKQLNEVERADEVARMLGGTKITKTTRAHAEEMLKNSK